VTGKRIAGHATNMAGLRRERQLERRRLVVYPDFTPDGVGRQGGYQVRPRPGTSDVADMILAHNLKTLPDVRLIQSLEAARLELARCSERDLPWLCEHLQACQLELARRKAVQHGR